MLRRSVLPILLLTAGCGGPTRFESDAIRLAEARIVPAYREQIDAALLQLFGEPDEPRLPDRLEGLLDAAGVEQAAGPVESHTVGVTHGLYRRHCARCHGVTGDGRGPAALYQHPYPRDFRRGVFKHKSTERGAPPTDADLHAVLARGVAGTAMPSFRLLEQAERDALVDYVKYLAIRGQTEAALTDDVAEEFDFDPNTGEVFGEDSVADDAELLVSIVDEVARRWEAAPSRVVQSETSTPTAAELASPSRIAAGERLFHDVKRANCVKCHGAGGRGAGELKEFDDWDQRRHAFAEATVRLAGQAATLRGQTNQAPEAARGQLAERLSTLTRQIAERRAVADQLLPARPAVPRALAGGVLHGGREPIDLFRVIHEGVAGTPMPGVGAALSDDEVWDLVAYVRSLTSATLVAENAP